MYQCCIFDLDGTLLDTLYAISYSANMTIAQYGCGTIAEERYKVLVGDGAAKLIERALLEFGEDKRKYCKEAVKTYEKVFREHCTDDISPYDGICDMLEALKKMGIKIAVLSNKPHARTLDNVEYIFGKGYFDHVQGQIETIQKKPDPSGVYMIMEKLGVTKEECLYLGDTNTDMMTGQNAGLDTAGVLWGFRTEEELRSYNPKYILKHPSEIVSIVEKNI